MRIILRWTRKMMLFLVYAQEIKKKKSELLLSCLSAVG